MFKYLNLNTLNKIKIIKQNITLNKNIFSQKNLKYFSDNKPENTKETDKDSTLPGEIVKFKFVYQNDKKEIPVEAHEGQHLLEIAHKYDVDLEGACDASLACSTCHIILEKEIYDQLPPAIEEEEDLLDLAYGLSETSRLGCQTKVTKIFEGTSVYVPSATRNLYVDGKKPAKH